MYRANDCRRFATLLIRSPSSPSTRPEIKNRSHDRASAGSGRCLSSDGQEFFTRWGHTLSAPQRKVFRDICACRTGALGARFEQCNHCSHHNVQFLSCRHRHCPKCQSTARDRWLERTAKELLPVPYRHVVFTLPGALAPLARQNTQLIYDLLFRCVSETLLTIGRDPSRLGAELGFLAVLHTWNQK